MKIQVVRQILPPVKAVQYKGDVTKIPYEMGTAITSASKSGCLIDNGHGTPIQHCLNGDWIIKDLRGLFVVVSKNMYKKSYMKVADA